MAGGLINLEHLRISVVKLKEYTNKTYANIGHRHDDDYTSFDYINSVIEQLEEKIFESSVKEHTHRSSDISQMTDYVIATDEEEISANDSLNTAMGKLEYRINNLTIKEHNHDDLYLKLNDTANAAKKLETEVKIDFTGGITGNTTFDGSTDITIDTVISEIPSNKVTTMSGYSKPEDTSSITYADSLNTAIGKLERALDLKQDVSGSLEFGEIQAYIEQEIQDLIGGSDIPSSLDTLRELASAIGDDPYFYENIYEALKEKADKEHDHDLASEEASGFMSSDDKYKLNRVEDNANHYIHPTTSGYIHVPSGGESGQMLAWLDDGVAQWVSYTPDSATDTDIESLLDIIFPIN